MKSQKSGGKNIKRWVAQEQKKESRVNEGAERFEGDGDEKVWSLKGKVKSGVKSLESGVKNIKQWVESRESGVKRIKSGV